MKKSCLYFDKNVSFIVNYKGLTLTTISLAWLVLICLEAH